MKKVAKGSTLAIVAPAGAVAPQILAQATQIIQSHGYAVRIMPHVDGCATSVFAATDQQRAQDLIEAIVSPDIDAIICARGGYGAVRTLQLIPDEVLSHCDKWIVGFSDITALHSRLTRQGIPSIHGPMLKHIAQHGMHSPDVEMLFQLLGGEGGKVEVPPHPLNRFGKSAATLTGGNLSLIASLRSTPADIVAEGSILFIEDLSEYRYHIDRMMQNLRYSGLLARISGLVVGQFTDQREGSTPFGQDAYQIIAQAVADYHYPTIFDFPAGHSQEVNMPLLLGKRATIISSAAGGELIYEA